MTGRPDRLPTAWNSAAESPLRWERGVFGAGSDRLTGRRSGVAGDWDSLGVVQVGLLDRTLPIRGGEIVVKCSTPLNR